MSKLIDLNNVQIFITANKIRQTTYFVYRIVALHLWKFCLSSFSRAACMTTYYPPIFRFQSLEVDC